MSGHDHQPSSHHQHHHHHHHHHEGGDPHHHDFFALEDMLRREFELKKDRLVEFLSRAGLKEGQHVLELGCGFAPLLELYCDAVGPSGSVTLVDPEARMGERLSERLAARPNARFVSCRAEDLAVSEAARPVGGGGGYDLVTMINVYHHLADPPAALAALRQALRPAGGRLVIADFIHDTARLFTSAAASAAAQSAQARLADLVRPAASSVTARCVETLGAAGFQLRLRDCFALQDRLRSPLGDYFLEMPQALHKLEGDARMEQLAKDLAELRDGDPEAVIFSHLYVLLAADSV